jgi:hypothetical protein
MLRRRGGDVERRWPSASRAKHDQERHRGPRRTSARGAQDVPKVRLKDPKDFRLIGKSLDRLDGRAKVDGTGIYGIDVRLPGMLTAVIVRPPVRGGTVVKLDDKAARARRGVRDVVWIDEGVAVIADGYWEARTGAELLQITWNEGHGGTIDSDELFASYEKLASKKGVNKVRNDGDAQKATASRAIAATYRVPTWRTRRWSRRTRPRSFITPASTVAARCGRRPRRRGSRAGASPRRSGSISPTSRSTRRCSAAASGAAGSSTTPSRRRSSRSGRGSRSR